MRILVVLLVGILVGPGASQNADIPGSTRTVVQDSTQALSPSSNPILSDTPIPSPTISVAATAGVTEQEQSDRMYDLEKDKYSLDKKRLWLSWVAAIGGLVALIFTGWRVVILARQAKEAELASYRERLFSEDPSARISAAMSLSKYPKEAIWLVNRWAREHKLALREEKAGTNATNDGTDYEQVKRAIQDALGIMESKRSWDWKRLRWVTFRIPSKFVLCIKGSRRTVSFPLWPYRVEGPRLDRLQITIDIGPIRLHGAYFYQSVLSEADLQSADLRFARLEETYLGDTNLAGADLQGANLQEASMPRANLEGADLLGAILRKVYLGHASLQRASLFAADLRNANLSAAVLQQSDLREANLQKAYLEGVNLQGADLQDANLSGASLRNIRNWRKIANLKGANIFGVIDPPGGFVKWALSEEVGAVSMEPDQWEAWKERREKEGV
ncbi:MAG: pentapeptide repeat-containing protein [bacterium]